MHLPPLIHDLAVICAVAGGVTLLFQRIRQPVVVGYIIAGILIGPFTPPRPLVSDLATIRTLAELGVIFLMFSLGLEFSFRLLARAGGPAVLATLVEVTLMMTLGYGAGRLLGRAPTDSFFMGAVVAISSTTVILKALGELGLQKRRFAEFVFSLIR
jgi:CPA2 family monovalent cation:H+ antiporter-2